MSAVFTLRRAARWLFEVYTPVQRLIKAPRPSQFTGCVKGLNTCSAPCPAPQGVSQPPSISTFIYQQPRKSKRSPRVSRRRHPNAQHHLQLPDILFSLAVLSFIRLLWLSAGGQRACTWLTSGSVFRPRQHRAVWSNVNHFSNIITSSSQKIPNEFGYNRFDKLVCQSLNVFSFQEQLLANCLGLWLSLLNKNVSPSVCGTFNSEHVGTLSMICLWCWSMAASVNTTLLQLTSVLLIISP